MEERKMRLIDADELKRRILFERDKIPFTLPSAIYEFGIEKPNHHGNSMRGGIRKALRCMEQCKTVDAALVVHGRWIRRGQIYKCSLCACCVGGHWNYCPNCGAKMDKNENT
jgi:hypothetical protein